MRVIVNFLQKPTPRWSILIPVLISLVAVCNGWEANQISQKAYIAEHIPRLKVFPGEVRFYSGQQVPGQVKIAISAIVENASDTAAHEVALNFETRDWYDHKTNLFSLYKTSRSPIPHILKLPKQSTMMFPVVYSPDAPSGGVSDFLSQKKPFSLKLTLSWKDVDAKEYVYVGFYNLESVSDQEGKPQLYFQPMNTYDSVKDGELVSKEAQREP